VPPEVLFEQRWPVDEDALRRTRRLWIAAWTPLSLLGVAVMVGLHGADLVKTAATFVLLMAMGFSGSYLWALTAHIRRATLLRVTSDGTLHVKAFPSRSAAFALPSCREVALEKVLDHDAGPSRVYRYDLIVLAADRKHEFVLPGRIGSTGNWSTFSEDEVSAFDAAVGRFTARSPS
jgi:hypothetical protein